MIKKNIVFIKFMILIIILTQFFPVILGSMEFLMCGEFFNAYIFGWVVNFCLLILAVIFKILDWCLDIN